LGSLNLFGRGGSPWIEKASQEGEQLAKGLVKDPNANVKERDGMEKTDEKRFSGS